MKLMRLGRLIDAGYEIFGGAAELTVSATALAAAVAVSLF